VRYRGAPVPYSTAALDYLFIGNLDLGSATLGCWEEKALPNRTRDDLSKNATPSKSPHSTAKQSVLLCVVPIPVTVQEVTGRKTPALAASRIFLLLCSQWLHAAPEFLVCRIHSEWSGHFAECFDPGRAAKGEGRDVA
jgi:hypothetical protein